MLNPQVLITPNFRYGEFAQPARYGCSYHEYPEHWFELRLIPLCRVLEVIREECGARMMRVISGFRSVEYNAALYRGTKKNPTDSRHSYGDAADITVMGLPTSAVQGIIHELWKGGKIKIGGLGDYTGFCHVDMRPQRPGKLARWSGSRTIEQTA